MAGRLASLAVAALSCAVAGQAIAQDLRDCPGDRLSFIDSVDGTRFVVDLVGSVALTACGGSSVLVDASVAQTRSDCDRVQSYTIFEGRFQQADGRHISDVWAVWNVIPAAPCCFWSFETSEQVFFSVSSGGTSSGQHQVLDLIAWDEPGQGTSLEELGSETVISRQYGTFAQDSVLIPIACDS